MNRTRRTVRMLPLGLICTFGLACPDDDDDVAVDTEPTTTVDVTTVTVTDTEGETETEAPTDAAMVRVVHAVAGAPAVDVYIAGEDSAVASNIAYGESSDYFELPDGENRLEIRAANGDDQLVLLTETVDVSVQQRITAVVAGRLQLENGNDDQQLRLLTFEENFGDAENGNALVRVIHAGPDAPAISIDVGDDESVEVENLAPFEATEAQGLNVPAGEELQIRILENDDTVTMFTTPELSQGDELFLIAAGLLEDLPREETGFVLIPVTRDEALDRIRQNPRLTALHAAPNAPAVDLCENDRLLAENLTFEANESSEQFFLRPTEHDLALHEAGQNCAGAPIAQFTTPGLDAGERYLAVVGGDFELIGPGQPENGLIVAIAQDVFSLETPDQAVIRMLHAAAAPPVVAGLVTNGSIVEINVFDTDLGPGEQTGELPPFQPGSYTIGLSTDNVSPYDVLVQGDVQLEAGERSWIVIAGSADQMANEDQALRYRIVNTAEPREWSVRDVQLNQP
jgi:hypothetical protein